MTYVYLSTRNQERLDAMVATGLWGNDENAVAEALVMAGIREAMADGLISDPVEVPVEEDPLFAGVTPHPVPVQPGAPEILAVLAEKPCKCGVPGCTGGMECEIPF